MAYTVDIVATNTIEDTVSGKQVYNTMNGTGDIADLTKRYHGEPCRHERK